MDWTLLSNLEFLADYLHTPAPEPTVQAAAELLALVRQAPGLVLRDVLAHARQIDVSADLVYALIAHHQLTVDLPAQRLCEPERVAVFRDAAAQAGWTLQQQRTGVLPDLPLPAADIVRCLLCSAVLPSVGVALA